MSAVRFVSLGEPCTDFFEDIFFGGDDDLTTPFLSCIAVLPETVVLEGACGEEAVRERSDEAVTDALMERFAGGRQLRLRCRFCPETAFSLADIDMTELVTARFGFF